MLGSRVFLIFILFYTLPLLETPAADISESRERLDLTSNCITPTNFQIFEEISPRRDDYKFASLNFSVDICIHYRQQKQTSDPRDLHLIQSPGQRQNSLECKWNIKEIQRIIYSLRFKKRFLARKPILYFCNSTATQQISLISWTIETNPGPTISKRKSKPDTSNKAERKSAPKCQTCTKPCKRNQQRLVCDCCFESTHVCCASSSVPSPSMGNEKMHSWTCQGCLMSVLPLYHQEDIEQSLNHDTQTLGASANHLLDIDVTDPYLEALEEHPKHLKFMHNNTQSTVSTFDELLLTVRDYPFDVVTMSETWLKTNELLLQHVTIPGYSCEFRNRESIKGGGVGAYIKESVKYKRRTDIEKKEPDLEHLWLELVRNKNSKMLMGIMYRSNRILTPTSWLCNFVTLFFEYTV